MIKLKVLSDAGWKEVAAKNKLKDNGLLKALEKLKRLGDDDHDEVAKVLDEVNKLATLLKKDKAVSAVPAAGKHIGEMLAAAESAQRDVVKAKADGDKVKKLKADADKKAAEAAARKGEDDEDDESPELLTTKLKPLLKMVAKGETMHTLVAKAGKKVVVLLSRKPIPLSRRQMLTEQLGGGSTKFYPGHCTNETGNTTFVLRAEVAGMAKLIKLALLEQTGLRVNKVKCRGEDGDDDDGDSDDAGGSEVQRPDQQTAGGDYRASGSGGDSPGNRDDGGQRPTLRVPGRFAITASVGRGGKNLEQDVRAVQAALNKRLGTRLDEDGACTPATIEAILAFQQALGQSSPDGRVEPGRGAARKLAESGELPPPPPPPKPMAPPDDLGEATVEHAPVVWHGTRGILDYNINQLKQAIQQEYSAEDPKLLAAIDDHVKRIDVILERLDLRLSETLERANKAADEAMRAGELASAREVLTEYMSFVNDETLIDHVDNNPFGVDTQLRKIMTGSLLHVQRSIA